MANKPHAEQKGHPPSAGSAEDRIPAVEQDGDKPDEHRIRERAYAIWIEEGKPDGRDQEHWLLACRELEREPRKQ